MVREGDPNPFITAVYEYLDYVKPVTTINDDDVPTEAEGIEKSTAIYCLEEEVAERVKGYPAGIITKGLTLKKIAWPTQESRLELEIADPISTSIHPDIRKVTLKHFDGITNNKLTGISVATRNILVVSGIATEEGLEEQTLQILAQMNRTRKTGQKVTELFPQTTFYFSERGNNDKIVIVHSSNPRPHFVPGEPTGSAKSVRSPLTNRDIAIVTSVLAAAKDKLS